MTTASASVADAFADLAPPVTITAGGREFAVRPATLASVALLENEIARRMRAALEEQRPAMTPAEFADEQAALRQDLLVAKSHQFGGAAYARTLSDPWGQTLLLWAYVAQADPAFTPEMAFAFAQDQPAAYRDAVAGVSPDFFRLAGTRRGIDPARLEAVVADMAAAFAAPPPAP